MGLLSSISHDRRVSESSVGLLVTGYALMVALFAAPLGRLTARLPRRALFVGTLIAYAGTPLQAFTAIGEVADDVIWQADEDDFHPWRRKVSYVEGARETRIMDLDLALTREPHWGHQLRRGLVELTDADFEQIRAAMAGPA